MHYQYILSPTRVRSGFTILRLAVSFSTNYRTTDRTFNSQKGSGPLLQCPGCLGMWIYPGPYYKAQDAWIGESILVHITKPKVPGYVNLSWFILQSPRCLDMWIYPGIYYKAQDAWGVNLSWSILKCPRCLGMWIYPGPYYKAQDAWECESLLVHITKPKVPGNVNLSWSILQSPRCLGMWIYAGPYYKSQDAWICEYILVHITKPKIFGNVNLCWPTLQWVNNF